MNRPKLTIAASLGGCVGRGERSESGTVKVTVLRPEDIDEHVYVPAASVMVYGDDAVRRLGEICRQLVPEAMFNGLVLRETGELDADDTKKLELDFRAPSGDHVTMPLPMGPAKDVIAAWWAAQQPK